MTALSLGPKKPTQRVGHPFDPDGNDNQGFLENAGNNQQLRDKIIQGRIKSLKHQIKNFEEQIAKKSGGGS